LLGNSMRKYVMNDKKNGYSKQFQNVYNNRIRKYATRALRDLVLLAEKLPEKQQAQIFNEETLSPLVHSIFSFRTKQQTDEKGAQERRTRILQLCYTILSEVGTLGNASDLAPDIMNMLTLGGQHETLPAITALKAIYLKGFSKQQ
jgi:hypothetical protein